MKVRDSQRSKCYEWERACVPLEQMTPVFNTAADAAEWANPIWRMERGRVGLAGKVAPNFEPGHWGQRRALAHADHRVSLPRWARSPWVVLHELSHRLTPNDEAHGARFVGVLIGLGCRHLDLDSNLLMLAADEIGLKYHVRSIGVVPTHGIAWHVERVLQNEGPMSEFDMASWLTLGCAIDVTPRQVRGASLSLVKHGKARWYRGKLTYVMNPNRPFLRK